ncbi:C40 family peptidase [Sagittula sp. NFXS13]|uniref:C40 family peptidase n=1 Tax=Sagittula sp. NFXS13 TaxID=2819095 RepID=UPI0032DF607F
MFRPDFFRHPAAPFGRRILNAAAKHAVADYPREACGLVIAGRYEPCENSAADPTAEFLIAPDQLAQGYATGDLQGVVHSHPRGPWFPSLADQHGQIETGVPWAIMVAGETGAQLACWWGMDRPPVMSRDGLHVSREFLPTASDCYSIVEDYFRDARGVRLRPIPRAWEWWQDPATHGSLYLDNLESCGFEVVSTDPEAFRDIAQEGDAYLMAIRSKVPNHAGIYLGDGLLLEHVQGQLSHREPIARKLRHITHWLRYTGAGA